MPLNSCGIFYLYNCLTRIGEGSEAGTMCCTNCFCPLCEAMQFDIWSKESLKTLKDVVIFQSYHHHVDDLAFIYGSFLDVFLMVGGDREIAKFYFSPKLEATRFPQISIALKENLFHFLKNMKFEHLRLIFNQGYEGQRQHLVFLMFCVLASASDFYKHNLECLKNFSTDTLTGENLLHFYSEYDFESRGFYLKPYIEALVLNCLA